jgi:hypothetical protein
MIGLDLDRLLDLHDGHLRAAAQQLAQMALLGGIEMGRDDEGEPGVLRHRAEQLLQRFQPTGRRADTHDRELSHSFPCPRAAVSRAAPLAAPLAPTRAPITTPPSLDRSSAQTQPAVVSKDADQKQRSSASTCA